MLQFTTALIMGVAIAQPIAAQTTPIPDEIAPKDEAGTTAPEAAPDNEIGEGVDMLRQGARRLMDGLMGEVEPSMRDLADSLKEWDFQGLSIDDLGQYHPPEVLPNGDIIIRRKVPLVVEPPGAEGEEVDI